ncbi:hypothetical protein BH10PSE7_BH10PSE7_16000 [soil metagenome]
MISTKSITGYVSIAAIGLALAVGVRIESTREYAIAKEHYVQSSRAETEAVARHVEQALRAIYESVRTLASLPSVRELDRHGANLVPDGREAIQQVYNNLASSVSVSEVYIVPASLDPEKIDPVTAKPEEPILMFDQLILHAGKYAAAANPFAARDADMTLSAPEEPEVEIHEYRQLAQQLSWLKTYYPAMGTIDGLNVPMISGAQTITCDNTAFVKTHADIDRSGVIFSVPFYGLDDRLAGSVSAIILSNALRTLIPGQNFALINREYNFVSQPSETGQDRVSSDWASEGKPDPHLIYSEVVPIGDKDPRSDWVLWAGSPDSAFFQSAEASAVRYFEASGYAVAGLLTLAGLVCWTLFRRNIDLMRSVSRTLERRVEERTAEIRHMAIHDALTNLPNRTMLREKTDDALTRVRRGEGLAVLCLDLDHFKTVNDTLGHPVGDSLLKAASARLQECVREIDVVARLGGDEFVVLQVDLPSPEAAGALAERIVDSLSQPFEVDGHQVVIGASIGIALAPSDGNQHETLLRNADIALYRAKLDGRGTYRFFEISMDALLQRRRELELSLRHAVVAEEFILHYQPMIDAQTGVITGFEALIRWDNPRRGIVSPAEFIPIAEEIGLIVPIGAWVINQACRDAAAWPKPLKVAVNLSPVQFKNQTLAHTVVSALANSGLSPLRLELEITESVLLAASELTMRTLHHLRELGVRIAMDDFGTGYSSLSYLRSFPFDKIKIDQSFVREITEKGDSIAIIQAMTALGKSLGMTTTAEGVETIDQFEKIREQGCAEVQGFYFSRPVPNGEVAALLRNQLSAVA